MTSILLTVNGAEAQASVSGTLTSGMVGVPVTIKYDESWEGLTKNLVCRCSRGTDQEDHRTILNVGSKAVVAHEVMQSGMHLYLGVEGCNADGTLVIPTVWAMCGVIESGANADGDISAEPTLPVWGQLQTEMKQLEENKLTQAQSSALHGMFKACVFNTNTDVDAAISAFEAAFRITDGGETPEEPDVPGTTVYTIAYELVNVNSSNRTATVAEGASCSATLTAADGYTMDGATVSVTMGGVDVTADVYADGVIRIASVTGNISIMASARVEEAAPELLTDGLLGFWDFRQPAEPIGKDWHYAYPPNTGSGAYMCGGPGTLGSGEMPAFDSQYGTPGWFGCALDVDNTLKDLGAEFTYVYLNRGTISGDLKGPHGIVPTNVPPRWAFAAQYYMESGVTETARPSAGNNGDSIEDYNFNVKRVSGAELRVIMDTSEYIFNGADYESFDHWNQTATVMPYRSGGTHIACAVYNRALTDVEIENMRAFMKTLEVSA